MRLIDADKLPYEDIESVDGNTYMCVNAYDIEHTPTIEQSEDCISRQQLLEALDTWDKFGNVPQYGLMRISKDDKVYIPYIHYDDAVDCIKALSSVTPQQKWIPVSERLPYDEDYVLVCYEDGHVRTAYYYIDTNIYQSEFADCCETGWYDCNEDFMYEQDVIAWMPLPQPYVESEE